MKLIALMISIPLLIVFSIWGIGSFLGPDDLRSCVNGPTLDDEKCQKADAIVTLSGGDTGARVTEAVKLYRQDWADLIIFSGAALDADSPSNAKTMKQYAIDAGIPASDIVLEETARDTSENALKTLFLATFQGENRIILVTSAYHQRRASMEFKQVFKDSAEIINHPVAEDKHWSSTWWLTPRGWWLAVGELVKISVVVTRGSML